MQNVSIDAIGELAQADTSLASNARRSLTTSKQSGLRRCPVIVGIEVFVSESQRGFVAIRAEMKGSPFPCMSSIYPWIQASAAMSLRGYAF